MSTIRNIAKNSIVIFVAQAITYLFGFLYMMYAARDLGPTDFGVLSFAVAFTNIFSIFCDWGLQTLLIREISRDKNLAVKYMANTLALKIILCVVTFILIALIINFTGHSQETIIAVYIIAVALILSTFSYMFYSIYQAFQMMEYSGIGQILYSLLILGGVLVAVNYKFNTTGYALVFLVSAIVVLIYNLITANQIISSKIPHRAPHILEFDWNFWKTSLNQTIPFGFHILFCNIYTWFDSVILASLQGNDIVGIYSAGSRIFLAILFLPNAFTAAIFPVMSHYHISSKDFLKIALEKASKYTFIIGLPIAAGLVILAPRIIDLIYGPQYALSTIALQILSFALVVPFLNIIFSIYLSAINRQMTNTKISFLGAVLSIVFNIILIPQYSYIASSWIRISVEFIMFILIVFSVLSTGYKLSISHTLSLVLKVLAATALMGILAFTLSSLNLAVVIIICAVAYFILIFAFRVFDETDIKMAMHVIGK